MKNNPENKTSKQKPLQYKNYKGESFKEVLSCNYNKRGKPVVKKIKRLIIPVLVFLCGMLVVQSLPDSFQNKVMEKRKAVLNYIGELLITKE